LRVPWDTVALTSTKGEVKFSDNGKLIGDLRLKKGEVVIASRRIVRELPEKELLENNILTPGA
jgi:ubiquitin carboxyl-terminal hydrolase 34